MSLYLRNLIFVLLQPGIVVGLFPYLILRGTSVRDYLVLSYLSFILIAAGLFIVLHCVYLFIREGKGTLSPADPTKLLVVKGLYRHSRNPMYLGVLLALSGLALLFQSLTLLVYALLVLLVFSCFIYFFEEPRLRKDFGTGYEVYCNKVRRWI